MEEQDEVLIRILAMQDAIWRALRSRDWDMSYPAVILEHRNRFSEVGVPWMGSNPTESGRKATQRALEACAYAGLVSLHGKIRRNSVKLTDAGEWRARALSGLPGLDAVLSLLQVIADQPVIMPSELALVGWTTYQDAPEAEVRATLAGQESMAAPAFCRGWLDAKSDCHGRVYFALTPLGMRVLANPPAMPSGLPRRQQACEAFYDAQFGEALVRLRDSQPETIGEIGYIPLSVAWCQNDPRTTLRTEVNA